MSDDGEDFEDFENIQVADIGSPGGLDAESIVGFEYYPSRVEIVTTKVDGDYRDPGYIMKIYNGNGDGEHRAPPPPPLWF
jgi:hypothetical protein